MVRFITRTHWLIWMVLTIPALAQDKVSDPFEPVNRAVFSFNETADRYVLKPAARGYRAVTPDPVENGIARMFDNLGEIVNVANALLQGKFVQAGNDSGRFLVNSTVGVAGFFDVAQVMGLEKNDGEDFGQTLGVWGLRRGPYLVVPFLGPSTLRDAPARYADSFLNPVRYVDHVPTRNTIIGTSLLSTRARLLEAEKLTRGDKYIFVRDVYLQRRVYLIRDGQVEDTFGSDYGEYGDESEYGEF